MSDQGRYRRVYVRLWRHPAFRRLSPAAKNLTLYLLTGPQTNRIGLFPLSLATATEDLQLSRKTILRAMAKTQAGFGWRFDVRAGVFYVSSWWRWNPPENANVLKGNLKDLNEIPSSTLVDVFLSNLATLDETYHQTFLEGCAKHSRIQEQEQGTGKQEQEQIGVLRRSGIYS